MWGLISRVSHLVGSSLFKHNPKSTALEDTETHGVGWGLGSEFRGHSGKFGEPMAILSAVSKVTQVFANLVHSFSNI